jgi:methylenetetrahydrofolate--tRNA-(uracil-5-)-methyltransferase
MKNFDDVDVVVVGGGLAGSEAAWQVAQSGLRVKLYEMRPLLNTGAHISDRLGELVCSNSLGSDLPYRAQGLLKKELRQLSSLLIQCADRNRVPAGGALAVDRDAFADDVTSAIMAHPHIQLVREEVVEIPLLPTVIASGPLTSAKLSLVIEKLTGQHNLYFYDAVAPIVYAESIDMSKAYRASRYGKGESAAGDYINCPFEREEYYSFIKELVSAERIRLREFEHDIYGEIKVGRVKYFEGCLPVELMAERSQDALAFGPLKPVGLSNIRKGKAPFAVVQLRQDNIAGSLYNLVGFQTNLTYAEQTRIFRMIPGLENATFVRYGQMHRNTFINSPNLLFPSLQYKERADLFFAGQITGIEGYVGNIATGLLAGANAARMIKGDELLILPETTMMGGLCYYVTHAESKNFQPMKANFGILPAIDASNGILRGKLERSKYYTQRAENDLNLFLSTNLPKGFEYCA